MSFTKERDPEKDHWMDRLPRIASRSKTQGSSRPLSISSSNDFEKELPDDPDGPLPKNFLRRQKEEETLERPAPTRSSKKRPWRKSSSWDNSQSPGGHVEQSAIAPIRKPEFKTPDYGPESPTSSQDVGSSDTAVSSSPNNEEEQGKHDAASRKGEPEIETFEEGDQVIFEDEEGNVLEQMTSPQDQPDEQRKEHELAEARRLVEEEDVHHGVSRKETQESTEVKRGTENKRRDIVNAVKSGKKGILSKLGKSTADDDEPAKPSRASNSDEIKRSGSHEDPPMGEEPTKESTEVPAKDRQASQAAKPRPKGMLNRLGTYTEKYHYSNREKTAEKPPERKQGPARAFKFGNTIIVEDEDGEVIKKYEIPAAEDRKQSYVDPERTRQRMQKMGKWMGMGNQQTDEAAEDIKRPQASRKKSTAGADKSEADDDDDAIRFMVEGDTRRMSKADFFQRLQNMDPKKRVELVEKSDAPEGLKQEARDEAAEDAQNQRRASQLPGTKGQPRTEGLGRGKPQLQRLGSKSTRPAGTEGTLVEENEEDIPIHNISDDLHRHSEGGLTAAEQRRRAASKKQVESSDSEDDGSERVAPARTQWRGAEPIKQSSSHSSSSPEKGKGRASDQEETAAERRRREAALGQLESDSDEDEEHPRIPAKGAAPGPTDSSSSSEEAPPKKRGIMFAGEPSKAEAAKASANKGGKGMFGRVQWGGESGRH